MTVSIRVMTAGDGFRYLLNSVAAGDGDRDAESALTRYYAEAGTPPGSWNGTGLVGLAGDISMGRPVSVEQLRRLMSLGEDPSTGEQLGRPYRTFASAADRVKRRLDALRDDMPVDERATQVASIEAEEASKPTGAPVAGFDLTFSVPKSVSTLWAISDGGAQALIAQAHHAALQDVLALLEREVAATRVGAKGPRGAVAQVPVRGVVAASYDHYDSRSSDPQLHTHVVVANRVQAARDGKWRTLDSRALHSAVTGLSEHYNAVLADHLTLMLGIGWEARERGPGRSTAWEITGVPQELMDEFSSRTRDIEQAKDRLVAEYVEKHGRQPSPKLLWQFRQQATLETRPPKQRHSLSELTAQWRDRATRLLGVDAPTWATALVARAEADPLLRADDIPLEELQRVAEVVVARVGDRRATWKRWNLHAEAVRQTMGIRFATATDRDVITKQIVDAAEAASLRLTPPELASSPPVFQRADGWSVFCPKDATVYSSERVLAAEDRLLDAAQHREAPTVPLTWIEHAARTKNRDGHTLSADQKQAISKIGVSGRTLDVLVGPAGTGKTTTMLALRRAWETRHGKDSVVGLAPSAAAAVVLGEELDVQTENTAKWLYEHDRGRWDLRAGQLVIIDEASLAGTFALDRITAHAAQVGAKALLVGDHAQLQAVDAGGAFGMLVRDRDDAPELFDVRRFRHDWEKHASLQLRLGDAAVIDTYMDHGRVAGGDRDQMLDAAYQAWMRDQTAGKVSVLIAETIETVADLNERARSDLILAGVVIDGGVRLHDGTRASAGDVVITRQNDRRLALGRGWVKNNDRWHVTGAHEDGSLTVRREKSRWRSTITLPAAYVAEHVDLGYAITAHRAQGATVDTAHAVVASPEMTREALYVAMTRGREANTAYVVTDQHHLEQHQHRDDLQHGARSILYGILQHTGAELSARETITAEQDERTSIRQLAAEYETIAQSAQHDRWLGLLRAGGLDETTIDELVTTDTYGILSTELRRLDAEGHDVDALLPRVVSAGNLEDIDDLGSLLRYRMQRVATRFTPTIRRRQLIAGIIPKASGDMEPEMARALAEREQLITQRAVALARRAAGESGSWATLTLPSSVRPLSDDVLQQLTVAAAYRDRYAVTGQDPLGPVPDADAQRVDYERARTALVVLRNARDAQPDTVQQSLHRGVSRDAR
ncbi:MobF family relaxase [Microbacterium marinilacus]|uniref:MobF family relaxase n=1 Tax=Microbacterium marinilacus TaxID=415209 RepID=UPI001C8E6D1E|nr:relaxase domain-containing protein [Microbacterium marinilacus]